MGFVVLLQSANDKRTLPILIGAPEAQAIAMALENIKPPRPLTHDLLKSVMDDIECRMKRVEICDLRDNTFFAKLVLEQDGMDFEIDARPSDAIALALRCSAPVFVAESVMEKAGVLIQEQEKQAEADSKPKDKRQAMLELLKSQIEEAVKDERYEDAAVLRDKISNLTHHN